MVAFSLCEFKDSLGMPGKGIHSIRIFNIAVVDVFFTFVGAYVLSFFLKKSFWLISLVLFVLGIAMHKLFCVKTTLNNILFR